MTVWDTLVGQQHVVDTLQAPRRARGMTHAWLFTGPPGSGRSNAAIAFAAALQCERAGCGECRACRTTMAGSNLDVWVHRPSVASRRSISAKASSQLAAEPPDPFGPAASDPIGIVVEIDQPGALGAEKAVAEDVVRRRGLR